LILLQHSQCSSGCVYKFHKILSFLTEAAFTWLDGCSCCE
jgi:hypothetical protein